MKAFWHKVGVPAIAIFCGLLLAAGGSVWLAGCGTKTATPTEGGTFISGLVGSPTSLDPAQLQEDQDFQVAKQLYDGLTAYDPVTMEVKPAIAGSWDASGDLRVFTFHLRPGVTFHNGDPCLAADFVYSWTRAVLPQTQGVAASRFSVIAGFTDLQTGAAQTFSGLKAVDDLTLQVTLNGPFADFPAIVANPCFAPVPQNVVNQTGNTGFTNAATGTGPFQLNTWARDAQIVLDKYPNYYAADKPHLDQLTFNIYPDANSAYTDFRNGLLQDAQIPAGLFDDARTTFGSQAIFSPVLGIVLLGFNMNAEPWKSHPQLRQALNYAVDRDAIASVVAEDSRTAASGIIPQGMPGFLPNATPYNHDPAKARELLSQTGYPGGAGLPPIMFGYITTPDNQRIAEELRLELDEVGIPITTQGFDTVTYASLLRSGQLTFFRFSSRPDYPIDDVLLFPLFFSANAGGSNLTNYSNPDVDSLLDSAPQEKDESKRLQLYRDAEQKILADAPMIPLLFYRTARVIAGNVQGYIRTAQDDTPYKLVYIK